MPVVLEVEEISPKEQKEKEMESKSHKIRKSEE